MGVSRPDRDAVLSPYLQNLIRFKSDQLCRKPGFSRSDEPDVEQELITSVLRQAPNYDPSRGASPDTFADRVVDSSAKMILRGRRRAKRAAGFRAQSLAWTNVYVGGRAVPVEDLVDDGGRRGNPAPAGPEEAVDTLEALEHVLSGLPPFHASVAGHLRERSASATAKELGVSRRRVNAAIAEIRRRCEEAGLGG